MRRIRSGRIRAIVLLFQRTVIAHWLDTIALKHFGNSSIDFREKIDTVPSDYLLDKNRIELSLFAKSIATALTSVLSVSVYESSNAHHRDSLQ